MDNPKMIVILDAKAIRLLDSYNEKRLEFQALEYGSEKAKLERSLQLAAQELGEDVAASVTRGSAPGMEKDEVAHHASRLAALPVDVRAIIVDMPTQGATGVLAALEDARTKVNQKSALANFQEGLYHGIAMGRIFTALEVGILTSSNSDRLLEYLRNLGKPGEGKDIPPSLHQ